MEKKIIIYAAAIMKWGVSYQRMASLHPVKGVGSRSSI